MENSDFINACISLKVPRTGIAEVDAVIREANRMEDIRAAMQGSLVSYAGVAADEIPSVASLIKASVKIADAMAQAREAN